MSTPHSPNNPDPNRPIDADLSRKRGSFPPMFAPDATPTEPFYGLDYPTDVPTAGSIDPGFSDLAPLPDGHLRPRKYMQPIPAAESKRSKVPDYYYKEFLAPKPEDNDHVIPKINLDYDAAPLPDPNVLPMPHGPLPFDQLALGGIRRRLFERKYLRRPAEMLDEAEREQNFYRSLANTAFVRAGFKVFPSAAEPVTIYDPLHPEVKAKGPVQWRRGRKVLGHDGWVQKGKKVAGYTDQLGEAYENSKMVEWARQGLEASGKRKLNRKMTEEVPDRLHNIEQAKLVPKQILREAAKKFTDGDITKEQYEEALETYKQAEQAITDHFELKYVQPQSKYGAQQDRRVEKYAHRVLKKTETGFHARGRKKDIAKWERKIEQNRDTIVRDDDGNVINVIPGKAQKKLNRLDKKVENQIKRRKIYKKVVKYPVTLGSKLNQARKSRKTTPTPPTTPPTTP